MIIQHLRAPRILCRDIVQPVKKKLLASCTQPTQIEIPGCNFESGYCKRIELHCRNNSEFSLDKKVSSTEFLVRAHHPPFSTPISFGANFPHSPSLSRALLLESVTRVCLITFPVPHRSQSPSNHPVVHLPMPSTPLINGTVKQHCCKKAFRRQIAKEGASTQECTFSAGATMHPSQTLHWQRSDSLCRTSSPDRLPS